MAMYRATIHGTQSGQTVDVITSWTKAGASNSGDANLVAQRVHNGWGSYLVPALCNDYQITATDVISPDDETVSGYFAEVVTGENATAPAPVFVCARVKVDTGLRGRSYQGRYGIPALPTAAIDATDGNLLDAGYQAVYQGFIGDFISTVALGDPSFDPAVISTIHNLAPRVPPIVTEATTVTVLQKLGSRVSRKD